MIKKVHACNKMNFSSNINEAIKAVLISSFFFYKKISHPPKAQKAPKSRKNTKKHQKAPKRTKMQPSKSTKHK